MKKKPLAIIMAICMIATLSNVAFAVDEIAMMATENTVETIPVYGYVGPDAYVVPPNPEEGELEIYVELPTHIMFAAFEGDNGTVTSPKFKITNLSELNDVKVEIEQFVQRPDPEIDLEDNLFLQLANNKGEWIIPDLFPADYSTEKLLTDNLSKYTVDSNENTFEFTIGGLWSGSFDTELQPVFDMTIKFSAAE